MITAPTESRSRFESEPERVARELDHLALHDLAETVDTGDAVGESHDGALGAGLHPDVKVPDPLSDQIADFGCRNAH